MLRMTVPIMTVACLLGTPATADTIYKCKKEDGTFSYQEKPCTDNSRAVSSWGSANEASTVIPQDAGGHYFVAGSINEQKLDFIIDTGASYVTLPSGVAHAAGISCKGQTTMMTGNGNISVCTTTIQKLKFGTFTLLNVEAIIAPNLNQPLLGMNVLRKFRVEQDGGEMRLSKK